MKTHNWKHAPADSDAHWKCRECGKLDFNAIPDTDPTCAGNISARIEAEISLVTDITDPTLSQVATEMDARQAEEAARLLGGALEVLLDEIGRCELDGSDTSWMTQSDEAGFGRSGQL